MIDDEAIIIHVASGTYYNTEGIGGWVWQQCAAGYAVHQIEALCSERFEVSREQSDADLAAFFAMLVAEDLVTETYAAEAALPAAEAEAARLAYSAPRLHAYRDLKDLLALDPPMPRLNLEPAHGD